MKDKESRKSPLSRKVKDSIVIVLIGVFGALLYSLLDGDLENRGRLWAGATVGLIGGGFIAINEIWMVSRKLRQLRFTNFVIYKSISYTIFFAAIIILVLSFERSSEEDMSIYKYFQSDAFNNFIWNEDLHIMMIYSLTATIGFVFVYQISRKMGQGVLWNFISGKYHKPRQEERIFMFLDLNNSTSLAEDIGDIEYNRLLSDFFFDITDSIISHYGEIYRYVGDEVVVSWKPKHGLKNANCIRAFFHSKRALHLNKEKYLKKYGLVPSFTAGFHVGNVIVGEIGEIKSQISFLGNVMYETAELEKSCKKYDTDNLISETLVEQINLPNIYSSKREGVFNNLENIPIAVYSIEEK